MIREVVVLAGGLGTRLRNAVKDVPKPMADINGIPFLKYVLDYLLDYKIERIILSVGYKYENIKGYFGERYKNASLLYSIETEPLGTGGAIKQSLSFTKGKDIVVLNGDTLFKVDLYQFNNFHKSKNADLSIALKHMERFDRYGTVEIKEDNRIIGFKEKGFREYGLINGGIYLMKVDIFKGIDLPEKFSFETDFLEVFYQEMNFYGFPFDDYFIDIGLPEDYEKAKIELPVGIKN